MQGRNYYPPIQVSDSLGERIASFTIRTLFVKLTNLIRLFGMVTIPLGKKKVSVASRFADVKEILSRSEAFQTPYIELADAVGWGPSFLLAVKNTDEAYWETRAAIERLWKKDDLQLIETMVANEAAVLMDKAVSQNQANLDAASGFVHLLVPMLFDRYFGIELSGEEQQEVLGASVTLGGYVFGAQGAPDPEKKKDYINDVKSAHQRIKFLVERTLLKDGPSIATAPLTETVVDRARKEGLAGSQLAEDNPELFKTMVDIFMDMIIGCATPTVSGAGKMIDYLLINPTAMQRAQEYATDSELDFVKCVRECLRLSFIVPGLWRKVDNNTNMNEPRSRFRTIKAGTYVFMAMQSALTDPRRYEEPLKYVPERDTSNTIIFGHLTHNCIGGYLAESVLAAMFEPLIANGVRMKEGSKTRWKGLIPVHTETVLGV